MRSRERTIISRCFVIGSLATLAVATRVHGQRVIYVAENAAGTSTGSSWLDAYQDLQDALDDARTAGDVDAEIWIAGGTYKPDLGTGEKTRAFELFGRIAIYGGFGGSEECLDERDPGVHHSILSGDLNGDDDPAAQPTSDCCDWQSGECGDGDCSASVSVADPSCPFGWDQSCSSLAVNLCCELCRPTRCDNSYNVLRATEPGSAPVLDGLTITGGEAFAPHPFGGGLFALQTSPSVLRCRFVQNDADVGSAFFSDQGSPTLRETTVVDNGKSFESWDAIQIRSPENPLYLRDLTISRNVGGGLGIIGADAVIEHSTIRDTLGTGLTCYSTDCTVIASEIVGSSDYGMYADGFTQIINSRFLGNLNTAVNAPFSGALVVNSIFAGNIAVYGAGLRCSSAWVLDSVFVSNTANLIAGLGVGDGGATIRNSIFWGNLDKTGSTELAQIRGNDRAYLRVDHSIVQDWTGSLGGVGNSGVDPTFVDADGADDIAGTEDDDLRLSPGSSAINAGDPNTTGLPPTDLDGHARVLCNRVDIGAYEFGIGDFNCDQTVDLFDFSSWEQCMTGPGANTIPPGCEAFDSNADSDVDLFDFAALQRALLAP